MLNEQEISRLLDAAVEGHLNEEEARQLLALLEESGELRTRVALASIVQRVLGTAKLPPVTGDRVMRALRAGGVIPDHDPGKAVPRKIKAVQDRPEIPGAGGVRRKRESGYPVAASVRQFPVGIAVMILLAGVIVGAGVWWRMKEGGPTAPRPAAALSASPARSQGNPSGGTVAATQSVFILSPVSGATGPVSVVDAASVATLPSEDQEMPESAFQDDSPPPAGDGAGEPGFVPPPDLGAVSSVSDPRIGGTSTGGTSGTQPRNPPQSPVMFIKLDLGNPRYWNVTPNDLDGLLMEIKARMGLSYRMEVRSLDQIKADPEKNPVLYLSGHYHFAFTPAQRALLRKFMMAGGMMVFDSGLGSKPFYDSARRELRLIFRDAPLQRLSSDHPVFRSYYEIPRVHYGEGVRAGGGRVDDNAPWIEGVTIHCRTVAVLSRWGMAIGWQKGAREDQPAYSSEDAIRLGVNLFSYAHALRGWTKQTSVIGPLIDPASAPSGDRLFVGQIRYEGEWNPRPSAFPMLLKTFNQRTAVPVRLDIRELRLNDSRVFDSPILYLTGHEGFRFSNEDISMLRKYLASGGFLYAEACCGRRGFDQAFRAEMGRVFPGKIIARIQPDNDVFSIPNVVKKMSVTPSLANLLGTTVVAPKLEGFELNGHLTVIYSPYGLAGSWEMTQNPYALGYNDAESLRLGQNILMYALTH